MKLGRIAATAAITGALAFGGISTAHAGQFTDSGHLSCPAGSVVQLNVDYSGQGKLTYNITTEGEQVVALPFGKPNGSDSPNETVTSNLQLNTWKQTSDWNVWMENGTSTTTATCVSN